MKRGWFRSERSERPCPAAEDLWAFVEGGIASEARDGIREHLISCAWCSEKVARMADPAAPVSEPVPAGLDRKTRQLWTRNPVAVLWRSQVLWMLLFIGSLGTSFATPRYYKQFLVLALVSGIRWALSERARHSITISKLSTAQDTSRISSRTKDRSPL